jgi:hypothetical protein
VGTEVDCSEMIVLREIRGKCVSNMSMWVSIGGIELATSLLMPQLACWVMTIGARNHCSFLTFAYSIDYNNLNYWLDNYLGHCSRTRLFSPFILHVHATRYLAMSV